MDQDFRTLTQSSLLLQHKWWSVLLFAAAWDTQSQLLNLVEALVPPGKAIKMFISSASSLLALAAALTSSFLRVFR